MGIRCSECSRQFDDAGGLANHDCDGNNVTILVINPQVADGEENPARVFEDREEAEEVREELEYATRMIDAPLIESGGEDDA